MITQTAERLLTAEDWSAVPEAEGVRYELAEGRLVRMPDPTGGHEKAVTELLFLLRGAFPRSEWEVLPGTGVTLAKNTVLIPDVRVLRKSAFDRTVNRYPAKAMLIVVEVLSPSDHRDDTIKKRRQYEQAGIPHYWIFDVREDRNGPWATIFKLVDGTYQEQPALGPDGVVTTTDPARLSFTLADLTD